MKPIRLFIVDPSFDGPAPGYWQAALAAIRECGRIAVVGSATSPAAALSQLQRVHADLFVVDLTQRTSDTEVLLDALAALRDGHDETPVIGLCDVVDEPHLALSISVGARACAGRDDPGALVTAVIEVARGGVPIQRDLAGKPSLLWNLALDLRRRFRGTLQLSGNRAGDPASAGSSGEDCPISVREIAILELVADGFSYREIGETLAIAERTVKNHMARSLEKLGARGRAHAVRVALEAGWICKGPGAGTVELQVAA